MEWYLKVLRNYVGFGGRARRKEYWMFILINLIVAIGIGVVEGVVGLADAGYGPVSLLYMLGVLLPSVAVAFRRLHDIEKSGWWVLINFIPLLGWLVFLYFMVKDGDPGENQYGANPKAA